MGNRFWGWVKDNALVIFGALAGIAALACGVARVAKLVRVARVKAKMPFAIVLNHPDEIAIRTEEGQDILMTLPEGITSDQVVAAGLDDSGSWAVEIQHVLTDRKGDALAGGGSHDLSL